MEIYLMQHGLALSAEENAERPLSQAGIQGIKATGAAIKRQGLSFDLILHSPKKRARQTAALIAEMINFPYSDLTETPLLLPQSSAEEVVGFLARNKMEQKVLLVGHLPLLPVLAARLLNEEANVGIRFENGGLCRIDVSAWNPAAAELVYLLTADQLRLTVFHGS